MKRSDRLLDLIQRRYPGYHPIVSLADIAHDPSAPLALSYLCHKTIIRYIEPEVRAVDAIEEERPNNFISVKMFGAELGNEEIKVIEDQSASQTEVIQPATQGIVYAYEDQSATQTEALVQERATVASIMSSASISRSSGAGTRSRGRSGSNSKIIKDILSDEVSELDELKECKGIHGRNVSNDSEGSDVSVGLGTSWLEAFKE